MVLGRDACRLSLIAPNTVRRVREVLDRAGYTEPRALDVLGVSELPPLRRRREGLSLSLHRTRGGMPLDTFVRLFLLRQPVPLEAARRAVEPLAPEDWAELGLLRIGGDEVRAAVELCPSQGLLAAADWPGRPRTDRHQVMGIAASSRLLAHLTIRRRSRQTLDLGTGCGVLAFLAADHSERVVAVDRNPRAIEFAQFNAQLNGFSGITFLEGDLFEPVRDQTFDLIVCNPPFVIGPDSRYLHSDSGLPSDQLCWAIVRAAPAFLREGGYCQLLCNWAHVAGQDWRERLAGWFDGTGCDAWVLRFRTEEAAAYASARLEETEEDAGEAARQFEQWMTSYERERIEAVSFGLITLRRSPRLSNWIRCDTAPEMWGPCGESIARGLALRDFLEANTDDRAFLEARLRRAPNLRWQQQLEVSAEGWSLVESRLQIGDGLAYALNLDLHIINFVARCEGERRLRDLLSDVAAATGREADRLAPEFLRVARRLVELGYLLPAENG